jgi:hypothetical protein
MLIVHCRSIRLCTAAGDDALDTRIVAHRPANPNTITRTFAHDHPNANPASIANTGTA